MNHAVISREDILEASRKLILEQGWASVNIRSVAAACGVAVGSIYNYFGSKSELVTAAVESVWLEIFQMTGSVHGFKNFLECIEWFYNSMESGSIKYPGFFTLHSMTFLGEDKTKGQQTMRRSWYHIKESLYIVLKRDENVRSDAFDERFTEERFVDHVFSLVILAIVKGDYDSSMTLEIIRRSIY